MNITIANILFTISEIILVIAYMVPYLVTLRILTVVSELLFILAVFYVGFNAPGMLPLVLFTFIALIINTIHIYRILYVLLPCNLPINYENIYQKKFKHFGFTKRELSVLIKQSRKMTLCKEEHLHSKSFLLLIVNGDIVVYNSTKKHPLIQGDFIGEFNFLTKKESSDNIKSSNNSHLLLWDIDNMTKIQKKFPNIYLKFYNIILESLREKQLNTN